MPTLLARAPSAQAAPLAVLAEDRLDAPIDPLAVVEVDRARFGAVAAPLPGRGVLRAEPGPHGPLLLHARPGRDGLTLSVRGPVATAPSVAAEALADLRRWVGADDDTSGFAEAVDAHPLLRRLRRETGTPRLSRLPRLGEAFGRSAIAQLVQHLEAKRSTAQLAALAGTPAPAPAPVPAPEHAHPRGSALPRVVTWPTAAQVGRVPTWELRRRCGLSLKVATALHAAAVHDRRLREVADDAEALDRRLRALPGVGVWTAAETRRLLGDPDAVQVGDYNVPTLVGHVLGRHAGWTADLPNARWSDAAMLELLAPFAGHRGRVIRLVAIAAGRGVVQGPQRRAPRAALSAHRYF